MLVYLFLHFVFQYFLWSVPCFHPSVSFFFILSFFPTVISILPVFFCNCLCSSFLYISFILIIHLLLFHPLVFSVVDIFHISTAPTILFIFFLLLGFHKSIFLSFVLNFPFYSTCGLQHSDLFSFF